MSLLVDVNMFVPYESEGYRVEASPDKPCKIRMPYNVAKTFVEQGLAQYCDAPDGDCPQCPKGLDGAPGTPGCPGKDGTAGMPGINGYKGLDGKDGDDGERGRRGPDGYINNVRGCPGKPGKNGLKGDPGEDGVIGDTGDAGADGLDGQPGTNGMPGTPGTPGPSGVDGLNGTPGRVCADGPVRCDPIENGYRFRTYDGDCNLIDDVEWICEPRRWCVETITIIDFDADDFKTSDTDQGTGYSIPISNGSFLNVQLTYGVPNSQPCRMVSCGWVNSDPYEDNHPNINAYGPVQDEPACVWIPMKITFDTPICGEITVDFYDVDKSHTSAGLQCDEKIRVINNSGSTLSANALLVENPVGSGIFEPDPSEGEGNTDTDGSITWNPSTPIDCLYFDVRTKDSFSVGVGLSGQQSIKTLETGTYIGNKFYDDMGNEITEPDGWIDCTP